jgi:hypothetical protein
VSDSPADVAGRLRAERNAVVAAIADGSVAFAALRDDARAAPVKVVVLAQAVPGVGKVRSRRVLEALGVREGARWGDLPPSVAARVIAAMDQAASGPGA